SLRDDPSNPLRNISYERTRQLYIAGLKTYEDFSEITEKDVLGLKGVGPVTIKDLKNNGVKFRDS
ncbi:helix-hairpin-helix domain-containing protein, partial [Alkalibacterium sp.]